MRRLLVLPALGLALAGPFVVGYVLSARDRVTATAPLASPVDEVRSALAARYYRRVPERVLRLRSIPAILSALRDPYTAYLAPSDYGMLQRETASRYSGIGVSVLPGPRGLVVVSVERGPAQRSGVRVGDTIVQIGHAGVSTPLDAAHALEQMLGPPGSSVRLVLLRGGRRLGLSVRRALVAAPVVDARLLSYAGRRLGVVRLRSFRVGAAVVLHRELQQLERQGAQGIVLDLRDDPGGLLSQAVAVASLFIDRGVVVSLVGEHHPLRVYRALPVPATRLPLVVLVDRYSASSSEIVAAALEDHHRATVVGERTFGKALVQAVDPLGNGAALELTIARYYTPSGKDISHVGVVPQIRAVDDPRTPQDEALATALRVLARPTS